MLQRISRLLPENLRGIVQTHRHFRMFLQRLGGYDLGLARHGHFDELIAYETDIEQLMKLPPDTIMKLLGLVGKSRAQNRQDLFALTRADFKKSGYFVEFGATNGVDLSNTFLLENDFGWTGILAEPAKSWHAALKKNRRCHVDQRCVWSHSGETLKFIQSDVAENSTIQAYGANPAHRQSRNTGQTYDVETISLIDLLEKYKAPKFIDFLSIDTEGSEFEILNTFDFARYKFNTITCEHNYGADRDKIFGLLTSKGYVRKFTGLSKWDDWYVSAG